MAEKRPLANYAGSIRELAVGDTLPNAGVFPFYRADGTFDSILLVLGTALPFYDAAGAAKNITLVA